MMSRVWSQLGNSLGKKIDLLKLDMYVKQWDVENTENGHALWSRYSLFCSAVSFIQIIPSFVCNNND